MSTIKNAINFNAQTTPAAHLADAADAAMAVEHAVSLLLHDLDMHRVAIGPLMPVKSALITLNALPVVGRDHLLAAIIREPSAAALILQAANSRYLDPITGGTVKLEAAVDLVGERGVREVLQYLDSQGPSRWTWDGASQHLRRMWTHTIYTALAARKLAKRHGGLNPSLAFSAAMLQNIVEPVVVQYIARQLQDTTLHPAGNINIAGVVASCKDLIGARLLESWNIPQPIVEVARHNQATPENVLTTIVVAAQQAALRYGYVYLGVNPDETVLTRAVDLLGMQVSTLDSVSREIAGELNTILTHQA